MLCQAARVQDEEMGDQDFIEGEAAQEMTANIEYLMVGREDEDDQVRLPVALVYLLLNS